MSRSYHKPHKFKSMSRSHTARLRPYKRERILTKPMPILPRCFEAGKSKVCYASEEEARAQIDRIGVPLRVYPCYGHYHLTSKL